LHERRARSLQCSSYNSLCLFRFDAAAGLSVAWTVLVAVGACVGFAKMPKKKAAVVELPKPNQSPWVAVDGLTVNAEAVGAWLRQVLCFPHALTRLDTQVPTRRLVISRQTTLRTARCGASLPIPLYSEAGKRSSGWPVRGFAVLPCAQVGSPVRFSDERQRAEEAAKAEADRLAGIDPEAAPKKKKKKKKKKKRRVVDPAALTDADIFDMKPGSTVSVRGHRLDSNHVLGLSLALPHCERVTTIKFVNILSCCFCAAATRDIVSWLRAHDADSGTPMFLPGT